MRCASLMRAATRPHLSTRDCTSYYEDLLLGLLSNFIVHIDVRIPYLSEIYLNIQRTISPDAIELRTRGL